MSPVPILTPEAAVAALDPARPLIVSDADEVLFHFIRGLERFMAARGFTLALRSFAITGNVSETATGRVLDRPEVSALIQAFHVTEDALEAVSGAADALRSLSSDCQVIVLSNVSGDAGETRARNLRVAEMPYPLICNAGLKDRTVKALADAVRAPTIFIDDLPPHHAAVAKTAPDVHRIHFVADPRLAAMQNLAHEAHLQAASWSEIEAAIRRIIAPA